MSEMVDEVCWHCWSIAISIDIYIGFDIYIDFDIYNDSDIDIDIDIDIGGKDVVESASSILTLLHYCSLSYSLCLQPKWTQLAVN